MPNNEQILTLVNLAMRICTKTYVERYLQGTKNSVSSCSPDQTHIKKSPKWPFALTLLNIEVLTSSLQTGTTKTSKYQPNSVLHMVDIAVAATTIK
jgi:hypothetical protein